MSSEVLFKNEFGYVELYLLSDEMKALRFVHNNGQGSISLYGGQVLTWQPTEQRPVFWLSKESKYSSGCAIRGGIPLCWPWFGGEVKLANGDIEKVNNHGFTRQSQWQLVDIKMSSSTVHITLSLTGNHLSPHWQSACKLTQKLVFNNAFQQTFTMENLSEKTVEYTGALHSYFAVSEPEQTEVLTLNDVAFDDKLSGELGKTLALKNCTGPIDRIYHSSNDMVIIDNKWQRKINLSSEGCQQWVLWNPGTDAKSMPDVHARGEHEFICLEAANTDWQKIASRTSVSISQKITVSNF